MLDESGYALEHEMLSLVKTDPILEDYGDMQSVICFCDNPASDDNYHKRQILSTNFKAADDALYAVKEKGKNNYRMEYYKNRRDNQKQAEA